VGTGTATYTITVEGITTAAITFTHSDSAATTFGLINTALNSAFGTSAIVASGASLVALILTFSGTGYSGRPVGAVTVNVLTGGAAVVTINASGTIGTPSTCAVTTAGGNSRCRR